MRPLFDPIPDDLLDEPAAPTVLVKRVEPRSTIVFDTYWRFAAERQAIYFRRLRHRPVAVDGAIPVWTTDPILRAHRFTNCYRAADRVSQFLLQRVIYRGDSHPRDVIFRTLLFKIFNKVSTWDAIVETLGRYPRPDTDGTECRWIANILDGVKGHGSIYSAAYVMPSPGNAASKHRAHLEILDQLSREWFKLMDARSLRGVYEVLLSVPSFGPFLAYQYAIDLNYSPVINFDEDEFVVPGPGARDGLSKCFSSLGEYNEADAIRWTSERQEREFERLGLTFEMLFGRRLKLIDCQNLYCEISKYARVAHPDVAGVSGRTKIKQLYKPDPNPFPKPFFPPKWGLVVPRFA